MKKPTHSALSAILKVTADALGKDAWVRFKTLPADTQAHLLCEAYLATLRERSIKQYEMKVATAPPSQDIVLGLNELREVAEKATPTEKTTRGKYKSRILLRYDLREFYAGTGYIIHLNPKRYNIETTQELRDTATKIACDIASGWYRSETRSDGWVTLRKKKAAPAAKAAKPKRLTLTGLRDDVNEFFCSSMASAYFLPSYYDATKTISAHLFRGKVSSMAHSFAPGRYSTEIDGEYVILSKKA
jgi:hypothetical protein